MGNIVTSTAAAQIGKRYVWDTPANRNDPNPAAFDCSGLAMWCYNKAGITLSHYTGTQYAETKAQQNKRLVKDAQPGDLVFLADAGGIYHVMIYYGGGKCVSAADPQLGVIWADLSSKDIMKYVGVYTGPQSTAFVSSVDTADAATATDTSFTTGLAGSITGSISGIVKATSWLSDGANWRRIGLALLGAMVLFFAVKRFL